MWWVIIIVCIILIVFLLNFVRTKRTERKDFIREENFVDTLKYVGTYVGGYPDMAESIESCYVFLNNGTLEFCKKLMVENPVFLFKIKQSYIKTVEVKNPEIMANDISFGKLLLNSDFTVEWERKFNSELAFVVINWEDAKQQYYTVFAFEGLDALQKATTAKTDLLNLI